MNTIVETKKGKLEGIFEEGCMVFKGVPYAKPPVGELRWKEPQEMEPWEGIREAKKFGNITMQNLPTGDEPWGAMYHKEFYAYPEYIPEMSEDCLYLNIYAPAEMPQEKLPVAFWIHGGGFGGGYNSEIEFSGAEYVKQGVIFVSVEYRCGVFGYMAHPWLSAENDKHISGNYGSLDQAAALNWVYDNIEAFGGDKDNITVFGQSAGSMSTQVLISSKLTGNKIAKAIMQSGVSYKEKILLTPTLAEEEEYGERILKIAGINSIEELRNADARKLMAAKSQFDGECMIKGIGLALVPNVDGYLLEDTVKEAIDKETIKNIPYMYGAVESDLGTDPETMSQGYKASMLIDECAAWSLHDEEKRNNPGFVYFFSHHLPGSEDGAFHSAEIWYTLGTLGRCWRPMEEVDYELSKEMVTYWTNFMKNGEPGNGWDAYTKNNPFVKEFK